MRRPRLALPLVLALAAQQPATGAPGPQKPALGWSNWNSFANNINSSLFRETASCMKDSGLLAAGYTYVTLGGIGYANGSTSPAASRGHGRRPQPTGFTFIQLERELSFFNTGKRDLFICI